MKSVILPCSASAKVEAFNGKAQRYLLDEDAQKKLDVEDLVLVEVTRDLSTKQQNQRMADALLDLKNASRLRITIESRRLSYGDEVVFEWQCPKCGYKDNRDTIDLSTVDDVPFPSEIEAQDYVAKSDGKTYRIGWGTGRTSREFAQALARKTVGKLDSAFFQVVSVNGEQRGPMYWDKQPSSVLDEIRRVVASLIPVRYLDKEIQPVIGEDGFERNKYGLIVAGVRAKFELMCGNCHKTSMPHLNSAPDFLFRGATTLADE